MKLLNGIVLQAFLAGLTLLFCVALGELGVRLLQYVSDGRPVISQMAPTNFWRMFDPDLGWRTPANQRQIYTIKDGAGVDHEVHYSTGRYGFRLYGDTKSRKTKIMIVGDSYTQALAVSDDQTYYAKLKNNLSDRMPVEIFAYGTVGYGTLQELMIVERHIKEIMPDIIIFQVCSNDFINNSIELESQSLGNNSHSLRPYIGIDGTITMQIPQSPLDKGVLGRVSRHSRFLQWVIPLLHNQGVVKTSTVEDEIRDQGTTHPGFMRAVALTDRLFGGLRSAVPAATKIYAFQADNLQPYSGEFEKLFPRHGITYFKGVAEAVTDAFQKGEVVYPWNDDHWASTGHTIVAEILANRLRRDLEKPSVSH